MDPRCVRVYGFPQAVSKEEILLFFESPRYCPAGGTVEEVHIDTDGSAQVSFLEASVATRLILKSPIVDRPTNGNLLDISRYQPLKTQELKTVTVSQCHPLQRIVRREFLQRSSEEIVVPQQCSTHSNRHCDNASTFPDSSCVADDADIYTEAESSGYWMMASSEYSAKNVELQPHKPISHSSPNSPKFEHDNMLLRNPILKSNLDLRDHRVKSDFENDKFSYVARTGVVKQAKEIIPLNNEGKMLLLKKLSAEKRINIDDLQCTLIVEDDRAVISGPTDVVFEAKFRILPKISNICSTKINISSSLMKLLIRSEYLDNQFKKRHLLAVLWTSDGKPHISAIDEPTVTAVKKICDEELKSEILHFEDYNAKLLQSKMWIDVVSSLESKNFLIITTEYKDREIYVEGGPDEVTTALISITQFIVKNSKITRSIKAKTSFISLLEINKDAVKDDIRRTIGDSVEINFQINAISITGVQDVVDEACVILHTYLSNICFDKLSMDLPGVKKESLRLKESIGDMTIHYIEMQHKCIIEILDSDRPIGLSTHSKPRQYREVEPTSVERYESPSDELAVRGSLYKRRPYKTLDPRRSESVASTDDPTLKLNVISGSLAQFMADILVNTITVKNRDLSKSGIVSRSILEAGGQQQQQLLNGLAFPVEFGKDVAVTSATGNLNAKQVYHAAFRKYRDIESLQRLTALVILCLRMAIRDQASYCLPNSWMW